MRRACEVYLKQSDLLLRLGKWRYPQKKKRKKPYLPEIHQKINISQMQCDVGWLHTRSEKLEAKKKNKWNLPPQ
jgi:hypothetical protein